MQLELKMECCKDVTKDISCRQKRSSIRNLMNTQRQRRTQESRTLLMKGCQVSSARTLSIMRILLIMRMRIQQLLQQNNVFTTKILRLLLQEVDER